MKRLLHKNLWKAGLAVLMLMLLPLGAKADTYVSTITGVEEVQSLETQGQYYLLSTTEKNDWTLNSAAEYDNDAKYAVLNTESHNPISLNSSFQVSGTILSVTVECQSSDGGTFSLSTADRTSITYSYEIGSANALTTYSFTPDEGSFETDNTSLTLTYNSKSGGNLNISKITITTGVSYHITLFNGEAHKVVVSDLNYRDVLGDGTNGHGPSVSYNPTTSTLVLNNASFGSPSGSMECSLPSLNIQLLGSNTMKSLEGFIFFPEAPEATTAGNLTFLTDENNPGSLSFIDYNDQGGPIYEEMLFSGVNVTYQNGLSLNAIYDDNPEMSEEAIAYVIRSNQAIKPIINEEDPDRDIVIVGTIYGDLDGKVISDVYYTLTSDEGYYDNSDGTNGVVVKVGMSDAEVEAAIEAGKPGTPAFDALFRGITMMVPAGIGKVTINAKGSAAGAVLMTKLGAAAAVDHPLTTDYADYVVEYQCTEATYLYIYVLQEPATARPGGPRPYKVQTTTVKVTGYKGNSAAVVNSVGGVQTASVYSVSCTGYRAGDDHVTMSTVEVAAVAAARPVGGPMYTLAPVSYPISSLSESVFAEIKSDDKAKLLYIDLSGTQVKGIDVNRSSGIFNGINNATTIYLPDGNNDAGEPNVIINGECKVLELDESKTFKAPAGKTFKVNKVTLTRKNAFVAGKPATVFLPFTIPASRASELGTFHTFKEISGDDAVFNTAESGDIAANTPYIFVPNYKYASLTAIDVTLNTTVPPASGKLIGTYERIEWTTDPDDIYGFSATNQGDLTQGQFFKVKASSYILPFRAYLKVTSASSRLRLVIGDDTTGITTISNPESEDNIWYSLDGQRHQGKPAKQGVYIHNNQKVLVK